MRIQTEQTCGTPRPYPRRSTGGVPGDVVELRFGLGKFFLELWALEQGLPQGLAENPPRHDVAVVVGSAHGTIPTNFLPPLQERLAASRATSANSRACTVAQVECPLGYASEA